MKKTILIPILFSALAAVAQSSDSGGEIITDRPDQTESPYAVKPGIIQIETGILFERSDFDNVISIDRTVYPTNLFRIGLLNRLELRIVNEVSRYQREINQPFITAEDVSKGTENMQVGLKYQFFSDDAKLQAGLIGHLILPTGRKSFSTNDYGVMGRLNLSYDISENKNLSANFGYANEDLDWNSDDVENTEGGDFIYTIVYGVGLGDKVGIYLEAFGSWLDFNTWENNMDAGMTYLLRKNIQLDYSYGWGLNKSIYSERKMNYHSIGISIRLPK